MATNDLNEIGDTDGSYETSLGGDHGHSLSGLKIGSTTLSINQMPSHAHNYKSGAAKTDNPASRNVFDTGAWHYVSGPGNWGGIYNTGGSQSHTHSASGGSIGNSGEHKHTF